MLRMKLRNLRLQKKLCMRHFRASPVLVINRPQQKNHGQRLQLKKGFSKKIFFLHDKKLPADN